ncbi:MAG: DUF2029 domain-containing protein [Acidobacteria bacterium]|nr:DUF2029 domain-containing protein [Acidobacteriota bacterium]
MLVIIVGVHQHLERQFDFGVFYYAAHMIVDGKGHDLYSFATQHFYQLRYHRPPDTLFRYPPIAPIPILPLTVLPMSVAFAVWTAACMGLLSASIKVSSARLGWRSGTGLSCWAFFLFLFLIACSTANIRF